MSARSRIDRAADDLLFGPLVNGPTLCHVGNVCTLLGQAQIVKAVMSGA